MDRKNFARGLVVDEMVANIDIAPTIMDVAGLPRPKNFAGTSAYPLARGEKSEDWRTAWLYEYYWEFNFPHTPTTFALRGDRYKLIQYHGVWDSDELYDLQTDPKEMNNLIDEPELLEVKVSMRQELYAPGKR